MRLQTRRGKRLESPSVAHLPALAHLALLRLQGLADLACIETEVRSKAIVASFYLLAAPSATAEARQAAIKRAEASEQITTVVAKESVAGASLDFHRRPFRPRGWPKSR